SDFVFDFLVYQDFTYRWKLPKNATISYMPNHFKVDNDLLFVSIDYEKIDDEIKVNMRLFVKEITIKPKDFELWNKSIRSLRAAYAENIVLKN
ncbi:hypothetical protein RZS08_46930, partial [Arthrospira platensis SPKY1]|nr:hypothetical protein [Arthrospira platensis SPKY1]